MAEVHKYFCTFCHLYVFGDTVTDLAFKVNAHNDKLHLMEFSGWTYLNIVRSPNYSGSTDAPPYLAPYTHSAGKEWGDAKHAPEITQYDKDMLTKACVKW